MFRRAHQRGPHACHENILAASHNGQVLVLVTIAMVMLIAVVALAVDVGLLWGMSRKMQTAAAAASAGAVASVLFPGWHARLYGHSSGAGYTIVAANQLQFKGNASLGDNYSSLGGISPVSSTTLYQ